MPTSGARSKTRSPSRSCGDSPSARKRDGRVLVDATDFFLRDVYNARGTAWATIASTATRSAIDVPRTKGFPKNTEIETILTFTNEGGGAGGGGGTRRRRSDAAAAAGSAAACSRDRSAASRRRPIRSRCASTTRFAELPDANYKPRFDDPRAGYGGAAVHGLRGAARHADGAALHPAPSSREGRSVGARQRREEADRLLRRSRHAGADPLGAARRRAAGGTRRSRPPAIRNAFRVELLPEGADPMDIRYNMINWVHRSTRGWSTGATISDPRTGEIIKATVTLGSLRDRQDYLIFEGLLAPYKTGTETPDILAKTAIARIRQLAAHEVGHTLGLGHQYYNSSEGADLGDGLSAPAREAERRRHHRFVRRLRRRHRRVGQGGDRLRLPGFPARHRRSRRAAEDPGRCLEAGPDLHDEPGHRRRRRRSDQWNNGTASTWPPS